MQSFFKAAHLNVSSPDFEDATFKKNGVRVLDVIKYIEDEGYSKGISHKKKKKIDLKAQDIFGLTENDIKLCKLIASLRLQASVFYKKSRPNDDDRSGLKVLVDENLSYKIVTDLMMQGLYISHVYFEDLGGKPDKDIWNSGANIIITHDNDFMDIAQMMYIQRCRERATQYVDTRDFPMIVIVDKKRIDKDIFLSSFRRFLPDIIEHTMMIPRTSLYGTFHSSGDLTFRSHDDVFKSFIRERDCFEDRGYIDNAEAIRRKHFPLEIDDRSCLIPAATMKRIERVRNKARFTTGQFNAAAKGPIQQPPSRIREARSNIHANTMHLPGIHNRMKS